MNSWLFGLLVALYPKAWRERYSKGVGDLSAELLAAGETTRLRLALELVASALVERVRSLHRARLAVLSGCAVLVLALVSALVMGGVFQGRSRPSPSPVVTSVTQAKVFSSATALFRALGCSDLSVQSQSRASAVCLAPDHVRWQAVASVWPQGGTPDVFVPVDTTVVELFLGPNWTLTVPSAEDRDASLLARIARVTGSLPGYGQVNWNGSEFGTGCVGDQCGPLHPATTGGSSIG